MFSKGKIKLSDSHHDLSVADMRRMWKELDAAGDAQLVSVEDEDESFEPYDMKPDSHDCQPHLYEPTDGPVNEILVSCTPREPDDERAEKPNASKPEREQEQSSQPRHCIPSFVMAAGALSSN